MDDFLKSIANILEVEHVKESDELKSFHQMDSLGILSITVMLNTNYGITISTKDMERMTTFKDIWNYVQCTRP